MRIHRLIRQAKRPDWRALLKNKRRDERWPGEWLEGFEGEGICSYPPEDLVVEDFGRYLKRRGKSVLSEEKARTVPFTSSVLDGIDVRETIRHWSEGKVFVRGEYWNVVSDEAIERDEPVEILSVEGLTLRVRRAKGSG